MRRPRHGGGRPKEGLTPGEPGIKTIIYLGATLREALMARGLLRRRSIETLLAAALDDPAWIPAIEAKASSLESDAAVLRKHSTTLVDRAKHDDAKEEKAAAAFLEAVMTTPWMLREIEEGAAAHPNDQIPAWLPAVRVTWSYRKAWDIVSGRRRMDEAESNAAV